MIRHHSDTAKDGRRAATHVRCRFGLRGARLLAREPPKTAGPGMTEERWCHMTETRNARWSRVSDGRSAPAPRRLSATGRRRPRHHLRRAGADRAVAADASGRDGRSRADAADRPCDWRWPRGHRAGRPRARRGGRNAARDAGTGRRQIVREQRGRVAVVAVEVDAARIGDRAGELGLHRHRLDLPATRSGMPIVPARGQYRPISRDGFGACRPQCLWHPGSSGGPKPCRCSANTAP
jgi:hypothetical protein